MKTRFPKDFIQWQQLAEGLLPPVDELSVDELNETLRAVGIHPYGVSRRYYTALAAAASAPGLARPQPDTNRTGSGPLSSTGRALGELLESQMFAFFRSRRGSWNDKPWEGTHVLGRALREARLARLPMTDRVHILNVGLGAVATSIREAAADAPARVDVYWPILEALEEAGVEAVAEKELAECFARRYAEFVECRVPALLPVLAWGINEFLERGLQSARLGIMVAHRLIDADASDQVRCVVALLRVLRPAMRRRLPNAVPASRAARDLLGSLFRQIRTASDHIGASVPSSPRVGFPMLFNDDCGELIDLMNSDSPLAGVVAMASTKLVLRRFCQTLLAAPEEVRLPAVDYVCRMVVDRTTPKSFPAAFLAIEAMEGIRDKFPKEFALVMTSLILTASPNLRQGIFICIAEGYEEDFGGERQTAVPQFVWRGSRLRFVTVEPHPLDEFGKRLARLATSDVSLRGHLDWMNARLQLWQKVA